MFLLLFSGDAAGFYLGTLHYSQLFYVYMAICLVLGAYLLTVDLRRKAVRELGRQGGWQGPGKLIALAMNSFDVGILFRFSGAYFRSYTIRPSKMVRSTFVFSMASDGMVKMSSESTTRSASLPGSMEPFTFS